MQILNRTLERGQDLNGESQRASDTKGLKEEVGQEFK